jgi:hypothetical protein
MGTGIAAVVAGIFAVFSLPFAVGWRTLGAGLWVVASVVELSVVARGHYCCQSLRIEQDGNILVTMTDGCCMPATLSAGSVVLGSFAWLRFKAENGRHHVELLCRESPGNKDWRRLQVIWRHLGAGH